MKVIVVCALVVACVASVIVQVVVAEPRIYPDQVTKEYNTSTTTTLTTQLSQLTLFTSQQVAEYTFERYVREFGRTYEAGSEEYNTRSKLFHVHTTHTALCATCTSVYFVSVSILRRTHPGTCRGNDCPQR